jgi:electron transfer flavoprotein beta subunit
VERFGGSVTVVTLGPAEAEEQLRSCLALGASAAVLLETPGGVELGPAATAAALHSVAADGGVDLVLLGNEAADTGDYQVGIRLAHLLGWPVATGIKALTVDDERTSAAARREYRGVAETYALPLPCVLTVREGINLPRYPSLPGRLRAKRAVISRMPVSPVAGAALRTTALRVPAAARREATVLGHGVDAVPALVSVLAELGVLS